MKTSQSLSLESQLSAEDSFHQIPLCISSSITLCKVFTSDEQIQKAMLKDFQLVFRDGFCSAASEGDQLEWEEVYWKDDLRGVNQLHQFSAGCDKKFISEVSVQQRRVAVSIKSDESSGLKRNKMKLSMKPKAKFKKAIVAFCGRFRITEEDLEFRVGGNLVNGDELADGLAGKTIIARHKDLYRVMNGVSEGAASTTANKLYIK